MSLPSGHHLRSIGRVEWEPLYRSPESGAQTYRSSAVASMKNEYVPRRDTVGSWRSGL